MENRDFSKSLNDSHLDAKRFVPRITFEVETQDYSVAEFHEKFAHKLPLVVMVSQGFCGNITQDIFDREQIMRLDTITRQKRVIAKSQHEGQLKLCSIPLTFSEPLCVIYKNHKVGKEKSISAIIKDHNLPVMVQFPRDRHISVDGQTIYTNHIPPMQLTECFNEMYILGNLITDGMLCREVIEVPLYLSKLRLVICTGIKGQTREKWVSHLQKLNRICSTIKYNQEYGNPHIAVYHPESIHTDTAYSYVEPAQYSSFYQMYKRPPNEQQEADGNVYEQLQDDFRADREVSSRMNARGYKTCNTLRHMPPIPDSTQMSRSGHPPPLQPKPKALIHGVDIPIKPPPIPARRHNGKEQLKKPEVRNIYSNDIPRGPVCPMKVGKMKDGESGKLGIQVTSLASVNAELQPSLVAGARELKNADDVAKLSIDEISVYLRKLRLEKYVQVFRENLVDGAIICELDKDMLQQTFGLNTIEAIRLMKFIKHGHIPS